MGKVKKDIGVAIFIGFLLGVAVALLATNLPKIIKEGIKYSQQLPLPTAVPTSIENTAAKLEFTLDTPQNDSIVGSEIIEVAGQAKEGQTIVVESSNDHLIMEASGSGNFAGKLNLLEGANKIYVTAYNSDGNFNAKTVNVYFTTEKL